MTDANKYLDIKLGNQIKLLENYQKKVELQAP